MPPLGEAIGDASDNDEYVAQLLAKEARESSIKYSTQGIGAYLPKRYVFLRAIIVILIWNETNGICVVICKQADRLSSQAKYTVSPKYS